MKWRSPVRILIAKHIHLDSSPLLDMGACIFVNSFPDLTGTKSLEAAYRGRHACIYRSGCQYVYVSIYIYYFLSVLCFYLKKETQDTT